MGRRVFRPDLQMPMSAMKTYAVDAPLGTHWRRGTCAEVDCGKFLNGWVTQVDVSTDLGMAQADYIRRHSGRAFVEEADGSAGAALLVFRFEAGQQCFGASEHRARIDRQEIFSVRGGDWRGTTGDRQRIHARAEDWIEDFAENQQSIIDAIGRG